MNGPSLATPLLIMVSAFMAAQPHPTDSSSSCDAADLDEIVGYTAVTSTKVVGDFEGADFGKVIKLDNGMLFEFSEYNYSYSYRPDVIVFARGVTHEGRSLDVYKLLIEDELYSAIRLR